MASPREPVHICTHMHRTESSIWLLLYWKVFFFPVKAAGFCQLSNRLIWLIDDCYQSCWFWALQDLLATLIPSCIIHYPADTLASSVSPIATAHLCICTKFFSWCFKAGLNKIMCNDQDVTPTERPSADHEPRAAESLAHTVITAVANEGGERISASCFHHPFIQPAQSGKLQTSPLMWFHKTKQMLFPWTFASRWNCIISHFQLKTN